MNHDVVFRGVVAGVLLTFFVVGAFMGLRYRKSRGKVVKRGEGRLKLGALGFLFLAWVSASVAFVVNPAWMGWSALPLPAWLRWTGVGVIAATFSLPLLAFRSLGSNYSGTVVIKESHTLVTSGPYRWIRHPSLHELLRSRLVPLPSDGELVHRPRVAGVEHPACLEG